MNFNTRLIAVVIACIFLCEQAAYALAPAPLSNQPLLKRQAMAMLERRAVLPASDEAGIRLLDDADHADCLLLSCGKLLIRPAIMGDDLKLLRAIRHEEFEALMQILSAERGTRYQAIKELVLSASPPPAGVADLDRYVDHAVASAFEILALRDDGVLMAGDLSAADLALLERLQPAIDANRFSYFYGAFSDRSKRQERIRLAWRDGFVFYRAAMSRGAASKSPLALPGPYAITMVSPESFFQMTGGLGNAVGTLSESLAAMGNTVSFFTIKNAYDLRGRAVDYSVLKDRLGRPVVIEDTGISFPYAVTHYNRDRERVEAVTVHVERARVNGVTYFLLSVDEPEIHGLSYSLYDESLGAEPLMNQVIFLARGSLEAMRRLVDAGLMPAPEIIHAHDWQAGPIHTLIKCDPRYAGDPLFAGCALPMSIHNGEYQGTVPAWLFRKFGIDGMHWFGISTDGSINLLKSGVTHGTPVTVSHSYAADMTHAFDKSVRGIQNGISYDEWGLKGRDKREYKMALQRQLGLAVDGDAPVISLVSRIAEQKGMDIAFAAMHSMLNRFPRAQFIFMGERSPGDAESKSAENSILFLQRMFPDRVKAIIPSARTFSGFPLPNTGALDVLLMASDIYGPMASRFEPSGQMQLRALAYAAVPVVSDTGGLHDTVKPFDRFTGKGTGFRFKAPASAYDRFGNDFMATLGNHGLVARDIGSASRSMEEALSLYCADKKAWAKLSKNAVSADFSNENMARTYQYFYKQLVKRRAGMPLAEKAKRSARYDAGRMAYLTGDLLSGVRPEERVYTVKYDKDRLTPSQAAIVKDYAGRIHALSGSPVRVSPVSSERGSPETLFAVYCADRSGRMIGEGHVDVALDAGADISQYLLRITNMLNIAFTAASIPADASADELAGIYAPFIGFVRDQYRRILAADLALPDDPARLLAQIRNLVLRLPRSYRIPVNRIEEYNRLMKSALSAA